VPAAILNERTQAFYGFDTKTMTPGDPPPPLPEAAPRRRFFLKACAAILAGSLVLAMIPLWIYQVDSHHSSRSGIWWPERGRNLIPPTATNITLRRDLLDHYAVYTVKEPDLNAFLDKRFARDGEVLDSYAERRRLSPTRIGEVIGPFGWVVTEDAVIYSYSTSNGASSRDYHDPSTGRTYQESAYW